VRLFDTNFLIDLVNNQTGAVEKARQADKEDDPAAISAITVHEYLLGVHLEYYESKHLSEKLDSARRDLAAFQVIPLTSEVAEESSRIQARVERRGRPTAMNDLYIASTALRLKIPLVTRNTHDFEKIPDLTLETY
jgi:tRNA(fMet)-specific endonuclease VapC